MPNDQPPPSAEEATAALSSVASMTSAGLQRGLYPRWFAAATAVWAGALATTVAMESRIWLLLFVAGVIGLSTYRSRKGAWVQEVHNGRDFAMVILGVVAVVAIAAGGFIGRSRFNLPWAPLAAGTVIAVGLFAVMEITYRPARARLKGEPNA